MQRYKLNQILATDEHPAALEAEMRPQHDPAALAEQAARVIIPKLELVQEPAKRHDFTLTLPRGCVAADRYGKPFIVWPDGSYGYDKAGRCPSHLGSYSFGPYTVLREGMTEEQCDAIAAGERVGTDPQPEAGAV